MVKYYISWRKSKKIKIIIIRFDGIYKEDIPTEKGLGKMCKWEDKNRSHWENSKIPCRSEGSLKYTIIVNENESSLAQTVVNFIGDLRNYNNSKEIINYFNSIVKNKMIRSGILEISVEFKKTIILKYDDKKERFIQIYTEKHECD